MFNADPCWLIGLLLVDELVSDLQRACENRFLKRKLLNI